MVLQGLAGYTTGSKAEDGNKMGSIPLAYSPSRVLSPHPLACQAACRECTIPGAAQDSHFLPASRKVQRAQRRSPLLGLLSASRLLCEDLWGVPVTV